MTQPVIGFIGVGLMGAGMAKNIVSKGYPPSDHGSPQPRSRRASETAGRERSAFGPRTRGAMRHRAAVRDRLT